MTFGGIYPEVLELRNDEWESAFSMHFGLHDELPNLFISGYH